MATSESKGRFFLQNESIRIDSHNESNRIDSNRELECSSNKFIIQALRRVCCCGLGGQEISIDCCTAGAQQQLRAMCTLFCRTRARAELRSTTGHQQAVLTDTQRVGPTRCAENLGLFWSAMYLTIFGVQKVNIRLRGVLSRRWSRIKGVSVFSTPCLLS